MQTVIPNQYDYMGYFIHLALQWLLHVMQGCILTNCGHRQGENCVQHDTILV